MYHSYRVEGVVICAGADAGSCTAGVGEETVDVMVSIKVGSSEGAGSAVGRALGSTVGRGDVVGIKVGDFLT